MHTAVVSFPETLNRLTTDASVVPSTRRRRKVEPRSGRTWAKYKAPPKWTAFAAFVVAIAIHIGAVAIVHPEGDERLTTPWENRSPAAAEALPTERSK